MSWIAEAAARVEARRDALRRALGTSAARHLVCIDPREGSWVGALQRRIEWWAKSAAIRTDIAVITE